MEYSTKQSEPVFVADGLNCQLKNIFNGLNGSIAGAGWIEWIGSVSSQGGKVFNAFDI